jgi:ABC-2 type transport system permease protein
MKNLFRVRIRQLKNTLKRTKKRIFVLVFLMGAGILGLMTYFFIKVFGYLYTQEVFPPVFKLFLSEKILTMAFLSMFLMLILSSLISTLNIFFLSKDLYVLLASPLKSWKIFFWKGLEVAASSSLMVVFFSLPVLFAYSYYFSPGIEDILGIIGVFLLFILSGVLLGIIIGLIISAFFSVRKLQPVLSLVSIIIISMIVVFLRLLRPERFGNPGEINNLLNYMSGLDLTFFSYFPFSWLSEALTALAKNDFWSYVKTVGLFLFIILFLSLFIRILQKGYYLSMFDKINKGFKGKFRSNWKKSIIFSGGYASLWKKEIKSFFRTPTQWSQLLVIGAIMVVYVLNIKGIPMPHQSVKNIIAYLNLGMAALIVAGLNSRFTFISLPMEAPGIIHLMASPIKREKVFHFKILFFLVPQLVFGLILFLAGDLALQLGSFTRISGLIFLIVIIPFLTVLALFFSLKIEGSVALTPQHLVSSKSGISYMFWSFITIVLSMIYFVRPLYLYYYSLFLKKSIPVLEIALWLIGFIFIYLAVMVLIYRRSLSIWRRREFSSSLM